MHAPGGGEELPNAGVVVPPASRGDDVAVDHVVRLLGGSRPCLHIRVLRCGDVDRYVVRADHRPSLSHLRRGAGAGRGVGRTLAIALGEVVHERDATFVIEQEFARWRRRNARSLSTVPARCSDHKFGRRRKISHRLGHAVPAGAAIRAALTRFRE